MLRQIHTNENSLAGSIADGTYQQWRRGGKKKGGWGGRKGKYLSSGKLGGEALVGVPRWAPSPGILSRAPASSKTILSLQQLHSFDQDSLKLATDCSHLQCKLWAGTVAARLVCWWALCRHIPEFLDVNQKLQPKGRKQRGKGEGDSWSGGRLFSWNLSRQHYWGLQAMAYLPPGGPLQSQGALVPAHNLHSVRIVICPCPALALQQKIRNPLYVPSWQKPSNLPAIPWAGHTNLWPWGGQPAVGSFVHWKGGGI